MSDGWFVNIISWSLRVQCYISGCHRSLVSFTHSTASSCFSYKLFSTYLYSPTKDQARRAVNFGESLGPRAGVMHVYHDFFITCVRPKYARLLGNQRALQGSNGVVS